MKVLFAGPYKDGSGWAHAAEQYILALDAAGVDVVPRAIKLNLHADPPIHPRIEELEQKSDRDCNIIIQNILPHMFDFDGRFDKNIGLIFTETSHFRNTNWMEYINTMDELWVGCKDSVDCCKSSHVDIPIHVVPVPCDVGVYSKRYEPYPIPELEDKFVFYFIGEYTRRKNLAALIKAYSIEFDRTEPVCLLIKTHVAGMSSAECNRQVLQMIEEIKTQLKIYHNIGDYPSEVVIVQDMSDEEIMRLHKTCDCFVMPSFGEGWNIPAFDAMAFGKTPICTDTGGMTDFLQWEVTDNGLPQQYSAGWLVRSYPTPCFGMQAWAGHDKLYLANENWQEIDVRELQYAMRQLYESKDLREAKSSRGLDRAYDFTHERVGEKMLELLNE
jgi:glycosyltransferase involved in cell wall biosynthesis